jgi:calcium-dependent protein kinase
VKIISVSDNSVSTQGKIDQEIKILMKTDHPNIINLFEIFKDENFIYLVTENCEGGELYENIISYGPPNEQKAALIIK